MTLSNSFSSAIGEVKVYSNKTVHIHITLLELTSALLADHYKSLSEHLGEPKYPFILTFKPTYLKMDAETRRYNNKMMNHWSTKMAVVVENALIRAFVYMYIKINHLDYSIEVFNSYEEAEKWIEG